MNHLEFDWRLVDAEFMDSPKCFRCGNYPNELLEYIVAAHEANVTPDEFVLENEGTLNKAGNTFCCSTCYRELGFPSCPGGWKAPSMAGESGKSILGRRPVGGVS